MWEQADILDSSTATAAAEPERALTIEERFERFHADNPHVYDAIVELAREAARRGERCGIATIFEVLRWRHVIETDVAREEYRLNNTYRALYARMVAEREPDLEDFFELRRRPSENAVVRREGGS